jgi:hypothetical protein
MLYFQMLFYIGSLLLLSYHCSQLIPDIFRTGLVITGHSLIIFSHYVKTELTLQLSYPLFCSQHIE